MFSVRRVLLASLCGLAAAWSLGVTAQPVFRIVGPDGRVTFSDRPPAQGARAPAPTAAAPGAAGTNTQAPGGSLPFELRSIASRYPVTLYTGAGCAPCDSGRVLLSSRGIPFNERTISTAEDVEALKRVAGASGLPALTIGGQQLAGFSPSEWGQFLDAAGYPRTSRLPAGYRNAAATPLVILQQASRPATPVEEPQEPQAAAPAAGPAPANPAGIRF